MADVIVTRLWRNRALFLLIAMTIVFGRLLPLDAGPGNWPGPDLILILTYAWVLRRPDYVPVGLVAAVILLTDILFMRPLGLWTALVILGLEFLRAREPLWRDVPFLIEWFMAGIAILAVSVSYLLVLSLFAVDQPTLGQSLIHLILTILVYPLAVLFSSAVIGFKKMSPGAVDQLGRKL